MFNLEETIHQAVSKLLRYHDNSRKNLRVLIFAPTGVASVNANETTILSVLNLHCRGELYPSDANTLATLGNSFSEVQIIIIDEIYCFPN